MRKAIKKKAGENSKEAKPPPLDPRYGDKTPAYARWLRRHHPEEFERKFANRIIELEKEIES